MNADPEQLINAATERMYCEKKQRIEEMEENLIKLQSEINMMQRELVYATDVYGIEATTNLQILITEQLNNLSIAKDRLNAEKGSFRSRKAISQRMEKELLKAKDVFLNFDNMPEDDLLKYSTTVYEQIRFGRNYKVSTVLSPLLKMFMTADTVQ